jgi:hypothetical protein
MAEERIKLGADSREVVQAVGEANKALKSYEVVSVETSERSAAARERSINRYVRASELANKSDRERIELERKHYLSMAGGKESLVKDINTVASQKLEALALKEKAAALNEGKKAAAETADWMKKLGNEMARVNKEATDNRVRAMVGALDEYKRKSADVYAEYKRNYAAQQEKIKADIAEKAAIEAKVRSLEKETALKTRTGSAKINEQRIQFLDSAKFNPDQVARINQQFGELAKQSDAASKPVGILGGTFAKLTASIAIAEMAVGAVQRLSGALVQFGKESALYAARTEQLQFAQNAVARGSDVSTAAVEKQVRSVQQLGITIQDARLGVTRMIATNMDFTRSTQLARAAQDLGRVAGINTAEAFERLVHATVTAQPELLRALGLNVSFEQSYTRFANRVGITVQQLTVQQKAQVALNAVLDAAAKYTGAYEASQKTAGGQLLSMERYILDVKQAIGEQFLPALTSATAKAVEFVKAIPDAIQKGRDLLDTVLVPLDLYAQSQKTISVMFVVGAKTAKGGSVDPMDVLGALLRSQMPDAMSTIRGFGADRSGMLEPGGTAFKEFFGSQGVQSFQADLRKRQMMAPIEADREIGGKRANEIMQAQANTTYGVEQRLSAAIQSRGESYNELQKIAQEYAKSGKGAALELVISAKERYDAESRNVIVLEKQKKAMEELAKYREKGREYVQERNTALQSAGGLEGTSFEVKPVKQDSVEFLNKRVALMMDESKREREFANETLKIQNDTDESRLRAQEGFVTRRRDLELLSLQGIMAVTVEQKTAVEQRRFEIVKSAMDKEAGLKAQSLERQKGLDLEYLDWLSVLYPERSAEIAQRRAAVSEQYAQKGAELESQWITDTGKLRADSEANVRQIQFQAWQQHFDSLKRGFESLFDAALIGGKNFADTLKRLLINAFLTPVKDAAGTWFANMFAGGRGGGGGFSTAGALSSIGMGGFGGGGGIGPGGTPPFWGGPGGTSGGGFGGFGGMFAGGKSWLSQLGNLGMKGKDGLPIDMAGAAGKGVGGMAGGAMLLGGGALVADGLRRGGWAGFGETTAGGALIGAKFGGPMGAAIGAAAGAAAGLIRMMFKNRDDKIVSKVRSIYGITIDKQFAKSLGEQSKGQTLDVFLRSAAAREQIQIYADYTDQGQKMSLADNVARGVNLSQSGGTLYQSGTYVGGTAYGYSSGLASVGSLKPFTPQQAQTVYVTIQADGQATTDLLEGKTAQFVSQNGQAVQQGLASALQSSFGRMTNGAAFMDPLATRI